MKLCLRGLVSADFSMVAVFEDYIKRLTNVNTMIY
ncbi:hypothetical protein SAMN04490355_101615 [Pelosinus propionicus DSM 13327]|uniref:Uncharacterized protein n=1 Tax=Pelosinus propionicus DSM 13327 TaxID=1123291 RepID=A0A1I4K7W4_9FIRM|nr:hypothetical protein SAMN04490355_101615 [Pelosinus propionicus DSM 13327]